MAYKEVFYVIQTTQRFFQSSTSAHTLAHVQGIKRLTDIINFTLGMGSQLYTEIIHRNYTPKSHPQFHQK